MDTILIATDFSPAAKNATEYGVQLAKFFNARLVLVNAYPIPPTDYETGFSAEMISALQKGSEEALDNLKKEIIEKHGRDFGIDCLAQMGFPYEVIDNACKHFSADLVVMGIKGHAGALKEHVIGTSAVRVARHLQIPAFIIPEDVKYHRIRTIAFACDLDKTEETDLAYVAKYFANVFEAELDVVNIENPGKELSTAKSKTFNFLEKKLESIKHKTVYSTDKDPAQGLRDYLKAHPADLVITNPKKHNIFHNLFHESVTKELAFHLDCPILTIH